MSKKTFCVKTKIFCCDREISTPSDATHGPITAEVPGSSFFDSDSGSETVQSRNSVPIPIPRLSMARTRFRVRFRDCTGVELDSDSGSETAQASNSIPILRRFRVLTRESWHLGSDSRYFHLKKGLFWVKKAGLD